METYLFKGEKGTNEMTKCETVGFKEAFIFALLEPIDSRFDIVLAKILVVANIPTLMSQTEIVILE